MRLVQALAVLVPFLAAGVILAVRWRQGSASLGPRLFVGLPFLAVGGLFWFALSGNTETDLPWTWMVGVTLGIIAVVAVIDTGRAALGLVVTAAAFPIIAVAILGGLYLFGSGVDDGAGGQEPFMTMAGVALMGSLMAYTLPALVTWVVMRYGERPAGTPPEGWYPDPGDAHLLRRWDGHGWTQDTAKPPPPTAP